VRNYIRVFNPEESITTVEVDWCGYYVAMDHEARDFFTVTTDDVIKYDHVTVIGLPKHLADMLAEDYLTCLMVVRPTLFDEKYATLFLLKFLTVSRDSLYEIYKRECP
jgi:hypothetical protein